MKVNSILSSILFLLLMLSCSHISEDERLIYEKPVNVSRHVLLEDFTGQRCINCPNATDEIARLENEYGEEVVVAVSIHSGPLGFKTNDQFIGLKTDTGDEYYNYWQLEYQPIGVIDREGSLDYTSWNAKIREELQKPVSMDIVLNTLVEDRTLTIQTELLAIKGDISGKLQLWITEDNVTAFQLMPDGTRCDNYVHQHVFRTAVNGAWGEDVRMKEGETVIKQHSIHLANEWVVDHLAVIAFVYDDKGVGQVRKMKLK